jgi:hypothetical protein
MKKMNQPLTALIDADVLRYEIGAVGEYDDKETGEHVVRDFDLVRTMFDERVQQILTGAGATSYKLFLTGDRHSRRMVERQGRRTGQVVGEFRPNFRESIAADRVYKGTRTKAKPFHWINLTAYLLSEESTIVTNGYEADDAIGIEHFRDTTTSIICTRDKDLRMVPGRHYGWECGKQPEFGPVIYDSLGTIDLIRGKSGNKIKGGGFKFFGSQLLTGDVVDNIGGLRGVGPVKAFELLQDCTSEREVFSAVQRHYEEVAGDDWKKLLTEQCGLLWIIRELNEDGSLKHFDIEEWL